MNEDPATERVLTMFEASSSGFNNNFDGDSSFLTSPLKSNAEILDPNGPANKSSQYGENVYEDVNEVEISNDWSRYDPNKLRQPISRVLKVEGTTGSLPFDEVENLSEPIKKMPNYSDEVEKVQKSSGAIGKMQNYSVSKISRRRPPLQQKNVDFSVNEARKKSLLSSLDLAKEEHELNIQHKKDEHILK